MEIIHATDESFKDVINDDIVLVDFFASWCGPCRMLSPVLEEISEDRDSIKIVKVDVDECNSLAKTYGVMSIPTLLLFKNGNLIRKTTGFMPKEQLLSWIEE